MQIEPEKQPRPIPLDLVGAVGSPDLAQQRQQPRCADATVSARCAASVVDDLAGAVSAQVESRLVLSLGFVEI